MVNPGIAYFIKLHPDAVIPSYHSEKAACCDIAATDIMVAVRPHDRQVINTGLIAIPPDGYHWHIYLRSSMAKQGLILLNSVGIIDGDYCGPKDEIKLLLYNSTDNVITIEKGQRVAQMRLVEDIRPEIKELKYEEIYNRRSRGGLGSTGY